MPPALADPATEGLAAIQNFLDDAGTVSNEWPREDGQLPGTGAADVGYPLSVELEDGRIMTAYYITPADGTTHVAVTHWHPDADRPA